MVKSNNIYYRKVERAITKWWLIDKVKYCFINIWKRSILNRYFLPKKNLFSPSIRLFYPWMYFWDWNIIIRQNEWKFFKTHIFPWSIFFPISIFKQKKGMFQVSLSKASYGILLLKKIGSRAVDSKRFLELNAFSILAYFNLT